MRKLISFSQVRNSKRDTRPFTNFYLPFTLGPFDPKANLNMIIHGIRYKNSSFILSAIHSLEVSRIHNSAFNSASIDCSKGYISFLRTLVSYLFVFKFSFCCSLYSVSASVCCSLFYLSCLIHKAFILTN